MVDTQYRLELHGLWLDMTDGPVVVESTPSARHCCLLGFPTSPISVRLGRTRTRAANYLLLLPDYKAGTPDRYSVFQPQTHGSCVVWRFAQVDGSTALVIHETKKTMRVCPLAKKERRTIRPHDEFSVQMHPSVSAKGTNLCAR